VATGHGGRSLPVATRPTTPAACLATTEIHATTYAWADELNAAGQAFADRQKERSEAVAFR
jgi:hypothetical protein